MGEEEDRHRYEHGMIRLDLQKQITDCKERIALLTIRVNELEKYVKEIGQYIPIIHNNVNAIMAEMHAVSGKTDQLDKMLLGH